MKTAVTLIGFMTGGALLCAAIYSVIYHVGLLLAKQPIWVLMMLVGVALGFYSWVWYYLYK